MRAVATDKDIVHAADGNGNGDAKTTQKRPVKRGNCESANAKPRTKRAKAPSKKRKR